MLSFTRRHMTFVWLAITPLLIADASEAQNLISGSAIWQITFQMEGKDHTVRFRGTTDGKIMTAPIKKKKALSTVIGSWTGDTKKTVVKVTEGNVRYKGTYVLSMQKESDAPVWTGTFTDTSGKERPVTVRLLKD
jgi:hypothetical protein